MGLGELASYDRSTLKSILSNLSWTFGLRILGYVFPLLTIPYLARTIGVEGLGKIAFSTAITVWVATITDWGFRYTATRDLSRCSDDKNASSVIYSNVIFSKILLFTVCLVLLFLLSFVVSEIKKEFVIISFSLLSVVGHILFPEWFFQAMTQMKYTTLLNFFVRSFFTIMVFLIVKEESDYVYQPLLLSLGFLISGLFSQWLIYKNWKIRIVRTSLVDVVNQIKGSYNVFLSIFFHNLYDSFSLMLLGYYGKYRSSGVFDAGNKFSQLMKELIEMTSVVFFPYLSQNIKRHDFYVKMTLLSSVLAALFLYIFAPYLIVWFYSEEFISSVEILRILAISLPFSALITMYGSNYMVLVGKDDVLRNIVLGVSLIGFSLSLIFVPMYEAKGVAYLLLATRMLMAFIVIVFSGKYSNKLVHAEK